MSKLNTPHMIIGAGLTGLIAAHAWPNAGIIEKATEAPKAHRALLRFRSDAVARLTGVEFRKVRVRKGIYFQGRFCEPNIQMANLYSAKVLHGRIEGDRSIWNIDSVDRFVAPDTFHEQLIEAVSPRLALGVEVANLYIGQKPVISTIPLPTMIDEVVNDYSPSIDFFRAPITVHRIKVRGADVFQTVYFPDPDLLVYRASMTGDTLIIESMGDGALELEEVLEAFGLSYNGGQGAEEVEKVEQRFGKIAPIDDIVRRELLFRLTQDYNVYSLGRFAIWKNILLDDVVQDIDVIKRLLKSGAAYDHRAAA